MDCVIVIWELYATLCSLTQGEAKSVVKAIVDKEFGQDGFKAFAELNYRHDRQSTASLLSSYLEVVAPPPVRSLSEVIGSIHRWESKVAALKSRYAENVVGQLKHAIFIGMMPKELQDVIWQNGSLGFCLQQMTPSRTPRSHAFLLDKKYLLMDDTFLT